MTHTADEIKKGLECCAMSSYRCEDDCPYREQCRYEQGGKAMNEDALALIQQLEAELEDMTARYKIADNCAKKKGKMNEKLYAELATVKAERDALLKYITDSTWAACDICKHGIDGASAMDCKHIREVGVPCFEWRGVQREE